MVRRPVLRSCEIKYVLTSNDVNLYKVTASELQIINVLTCMQLGVFTQPQSNNLANCPFEIHLRARQCFCLPK